MVSHQAGNIRHVLYLDLKPSSTKYQPIFSICICGLYGTSGYECELFGKQTQAKGKGKKHCANTLAACWCISAAHGSPVVPVFIKLNELLSK